MAIQLIGWSQRKRLLIGFFALQVLGLIVGHFTKVKFFAWAPYDEISLYEIVVELDTGMLSNEQIALRYRRAASGRENRSIHNLITIIRRYEQTYGHQDAARVRLDFNTHGRQDWCYYWPADSLIAQ